MSAHPVLYQLDARIWAPESGGGVDAIAARDLDRLAEFGIEWVWLMGVWQTGEAERWVSRTHPQLLRGYGHDLPGFSDSDIAGSPFAIADYRVAPALGGGEALARLRAQLARRGIRLMLDFVPNHTAQDHWWVREHPDYYIQGTPDDLAHRGQNYFLVDTASGSRVLAHGRDPGFDGWPDTAQLNYGNPRLREAVAREMLAIADLCDGVRCDMAMLLLPEVFRRTWGLDIPEFWPEAIAGVRRKRPDFTFLAEVYWDLEWEIQQRGFDYTYDKRLYDRVRGGDVQGIRDHLAADFSFQKKLARFIENHDEDRAASIFSPEQHRAAAVLTFFAPGMKLFYDGQWDGRKRHASVHLRRRASEPADDAARTFYGDLLRCLRRPEFHSDQWQRLDPTPAGPFVAYMWNRSTVVVVNYSPRRAQCRLSLPEERVRGLLGGSYDLRSPDMPGWGYYVCEFAR